MMGAMPLQIENRKMQISNWQMRHHGVSAS
jgi:hypothetical protein